jgi:hypothetical protein
MHEEPRRNGRIALRAVSDRTFARSAQDLYFFVHSSWILVFFVLGSCLTDLDRGKVP